MKQFEVALIERLEKALLNHGFRFRSTERSFVKKLPEGRVAFHLTFIQHGTDFDVVVDLGVRFDALERLVNEGNKLLTNREKESTYSLGVELGNLIEGAQKRWTIATSENVDPVANELYASFAEHALPYFAKFSTMGNALDLLSPNLPRSWIHSPIHAARAKRAVGLAALTKDKLRLQTVIETYSDFLRKRNDPGLLDFMAFVNKVAEHK